jgi:hypothetical protein
MQIKNLLILSVVAALSRISVIAAVFLYSGSIDFPSNICQWDCAWYLSIVNEGYDLHPHAYAPGTPHHANHEGSFSNWAFFPLFPVTVRILSSILYSDPLVTALILNNILFIALIILLYTYLKNDFGEEIALKGSVAFCFFPFTIYLSVPYSEGLFLTLLFGALVLLQRKRFILAAVTGALLGATRTTGLFFEFIFISYSIPFLVQLQKEKQNLSAPAITFIFGVLFIPVGLEIYSIYLHHLTGDALAFSHIQRAWGRIPGNPIKTFINEIKNPAVISVYGMFSSMLAITASVWLFTKKYWGESIFTLASILLPISTGTFTSCTRYSLLSLSWIIFFSYMISKLPRSTYLSAIISFFLLLLIFAKFWINDLQFMI